jgi:hypothetical protein
MANFKLAKGVAIPRSGGWMVISGFECDKGKLIINYRTYGATGPVIDTEEQSSIDDFLMLISTGRERELPGFISAAWPEGVYQFGQLNKNDLREKVGNWLNNQEQQNCNKKPPPETPKTPDSKEETETDCPDCFNFHKKAVLNIVKNLEEVFNNTKIYLPLCQEWSNDIEPGCLGKFAPVQPYNTRQGGSTEFIKKLRRDFGKYLAEKGIVNEKFDPDQPFRGQGGTSTEIRLGRDAQGESNQKESDLDSLKIGLNGPKIQVITSCDQPRGSVQGCRGLLEWYMDKNPPLSCQFGRVTVENTPYITNIDKLITRCCQAVIESRFPKPNDKTKTIWGETPFPDFNGYPTTNSEGEPVNSYLEAGNKSLCATGRGSYMEAETAIGCCSKIKCPELKCKCVRSSQAEFNQNNRAIDDLIQQMGESISCFE